ncbi:hypothetical protein NESM_000113900 [Novymonas esmeraldas]|uniref:START domain-containing protein n=1 Tax=Novymonas esmeraldas TaxID=1808958 RepID=A0AAW0F367_9TRYP
MSAVSTSSDADVAAAAPVLRSLLTCASAAPLLWKTLSDRDGFCVCELPPTPALGLPMACYRTQFTVAGDMDALHRVLTEETLIREYDPTLKELRVLDQQACGALLYTSYTSPAPWLVTARDFCVWSSAVRVSRQQLAQICDGEGAADVVIQGASRAAAHRDESEDAPTVFLQNSVTASASESAVVPPPRRGTSLVRGVVHCFGYVAVADASVRSQLHVVNYCCVDPAGKIPKWLVAAAVDDNTKKLKRMASQVSLAASAAAAATVDVPRAAVSPSPAPSTPAPPDATETLIVVRESPAASPVTAVGVVGVPGDVAPEEHVPPHPPDSVRNSDAAASTVRPLRRSLSESLAGDGDGAPPTAAASAELRHSPQRSDKAHGGPPPPLSGAATAAAASASAPPTPRHPCTSPSPQRTNVAAHHHPGVAALGLLARATGWQLRREVRGMQCAELRALPPPLHCGDPACVALRVSVSVDCTLDTFAAVLRSPALAPEIDPELVRVMAIPASARRSCSAASREPSRACETLSFFAGEEEGPSAAAVGLGAASPLSCDGGHLRHYEFAADDAFRCPWHMVLQCGELEVAPVDGGRYGFHTPGVPAATHVWVGTEDDVGLYRGAHPDSRHHRVPVRVFGTTAVAVPRSADTLRVSQYMLLDSSGVPTVAGRSGGWRSAFRKRKGEAGAFLAAVSAWMERRLRRLTGLCEEAQRRHQRNAIMALDKEPLLQFLYRVHCTEGGPAMERPSAVLYGDILTQSTTWTRAAGASVPPLLVLSTVFPCSLAHLRLFMLSTPPRRRYALEAGVHSYDELPAPPGFSAVRVEYGAASASFPWVRLSFLEAFGELRGEEVPWSTLVLSRTSLDAVAAEEGCDEEPPVDGVGGIGLSSSGADWRFGNGRLFCSGWVATMLDGDEPLDGAQGDLSTPPLRSPSAPSMPTAGERAPVAHGSARIVVMQYLCVDIRSSEGPGAGAEGYSPQCVADQVDLLRRFRDAVCMWNPAQGCSHLTPAIS